MQAWGVENFIPIAVPSMNFEIIYFLDSVGVGGEGEGGPAKIVLA